MIRSASTPRLALALLLFVPSAYGADPDKDGDGLSDFHETYKHGTDPSKADSDGDGVPDGDWLERREYEYTIRSVVQVMKPVTPEYLTDDYQDARVLDETDTYVELEVIHYPFNTVDTAIESDRNWRRSTSGMKEWTKPGPTSDWTKSFRSRFLKDLKKDGIDITEMSDEEAVVAVSKWLMKRAEYHDGFSTFVTAFDKKDKPYIPDELKGDRTQKELEEQWEREVSAVGMYENRQRGSCTSSAIYINGCMRALGIPTRTILCIPVIDANDEQEMRMLDRLQHAGVRRQLKGALEDIRGSWASHTFNEVFVGGRWRRLNYDKLGQNIYDRGLFGLITHVATFSDWADARMPETVGKRQTGSTKANDVFGGPNPYSTISLRDEMGVHCERGFPDPGVMSAQVSKFLWTDSKELPEDILSGLEPRGRFGLVAYVDGFEDFNACRDFLGAVDGRVFLEAQDHTLKVGFDSGCVWWKNGTAIVYVAFGAGDRRDLQSGVSYKIKVQNGTPEFQWELPQDVTVERG